MEKLELPEIDIKVDWYKIITGIVMVIVGGFFVAYLIGIRNQLWFTITTPEAVTVCQEGYSGEHGEANRRFELKQRGNVEIISPIADPEEVGKE